MEKIMSFKKMNVKSETENEFYLNPRDVSLNGKLVLNLLESDSLFFYLPFNEFFVVVYDEYIIVIDVKESISSRFKIIIQIDYQEIYKTQFGKKADDTNQKPKKNKSNSSSLNFCSSDDHKKIKNFNVFEVKTLGSSICFIIEYNNNDFIIFKYTNLRDPSTIQIIYKMSKEFVTSKFTTTMNDINKSYRNKSLSMSESESDLILQTSIHYLDLSTNNFDFVSELTSHLHLIIYKIENVLFFTTLNLMKTNNNFTFNFFHSIPKDVLSFKAKLFADMLIILQVNSDYDIIVDFLSFKYVMKSDSFVMQSDYLFSQLIKFENCATINFFSFEMWEDEVVLIVSKLEKVYLYILDKEKRKFEFFREFIFSKFELNIIKQIFIINSFIFVFTGKGAYAYLEIPKTENKNEKCLITYDSLTIVRDVYSVKKFHSELGFFILGSNSLFKNNEFNICSFFPDFLKNKEIMDLIYTSNLKIFNFLNNKICDKTRKIFFSFCLAEYILLIYRFQEYINNFYTFINTTNSNEIVMNEYFNLLITRLKIYINKLKNENIFKTVDRELSDGNTFQLDINNYLIHEFRSLISDSIDDINDSYEYGEYLSNYEYTCEICDSVFVKYLDTKLSYVCEKGHFTFSCCISYLPVSEKQNFYLCNGCSLVYSENVIKICIICQKMLTLLY